MVPARRLNVADLFQVLRHNGNGRAICTVDGKQLKCGDSEAICRGATQTSFVARLASTPSRDLGIVYWVCLAAPETSVFVPIPFGVPDFPAGFRADSERPTPVLFERRVRSPFRPDTSQAFWTFSNFRDKAQTLPDSARDRIRRDAEAIELRASQSLATVTEELDDASPEVTRKLLQGLSSDVYLSALKMMAESLSTNVSQ